MYTRSYYPDTNERLAIPDNYDGTALIEAPPQITEQAVDEQADSPVSADVQTTSSLNFGKIPFLSGIFGKDVGIKLPKIGTEEMLIIATAAFLFFSKDGDRECAIMLALLLLIN